MRHWARWNATLAVASLIGAGLAAQGSGGTGDPVSTPPPSVTADMLLHAAASGDWVMYGGNYWNDRYSPLKTISTANVKNLVPRMVFTHGAERLGSFETTPIVVGGTMYITSPATPNNIVRAFDLRTQKPLWQYEHKNAPVSTACCGPNNRGVAVAGGAVFLGTLDGQLVALDEKTGKEKWAVQVGDPASGYTETMAPLVIGDMVIIGTSGAEYGIRGFVKAYNTGSGAPVWTWYTLPDPQHGGWWGKWSKTTWEGDDLHRDIAKEKADSAKYADAWQHGGGSMWMTPAYDDATKTLFVAIGNPSPDLDGAIRPGDNLWTESVVAISATNGEFKWGYQEVPHDVWDLDAVSPPAIAMVGGKKAVVEAGKTGFVYVLDAATGKLIRRSAAFVPQQYMYAQPTPEGTFMLPGANGGEEWSPIAVHRELGYAYTVGLHQPMHYKTHYAPWENGRLWLGSAFVRIPDAQGGYSGEYGNVNAIDLNSGKIVWTVKTDLPMMGGATATAGGLVFTGEGNGWFKAYDAKTGLVLWKFYCGAGVNAAPAVFEVDGEEFIAVAAGGNFQISYPLGNSVFVFGLPKAGM
ncbi:MAG TPA: PQQ-binding-like beta-propeller repeat protein [Gemmatimonadales bacterium]|nr:PQQ-binding-like beta-propeller repeat protein [Gemmatimonadales bacterium]